MNISKGEQCVPDLKLIEAAKRGDQAAMVQILQHLELPLYRTAYYLLGNEDDASDATQEALIKVYKKLHTYQEKASLETWAQRIVRNVCMDFFRKKKDEVSLDMDIPDNHKGLQIEGQIENRLVYQDLQEAVMQLRPAYREVIVLRYIQDYSYQEIAETLCLPMNTVKSYLFRARQELHLWLKEYDQGGGKR